MALFSRLVEILHKILVANQHPSKEVGKICLLNLLLLGDDYRSGNMSIDPASDTRNSNTGR